MAEPSETELKLLERFRQKISDIPFKEARTTDLFLLTWIRARDNDLAKAEQMLRNSIKWRLANEIDGIASWTPPQDYQSEFPVNFVGHDNEGRPVFILCLGRWDVRKRVDAGEREVYIRYVDQIVANLLQRVEDSGKEQFVIIADLKQQSLRQFTSPSTLDTILETFQRFEANYPERLFSSYVVNAPSIFPIIFRLVKPLLSGRTLRKVQVFNATAEKWKLALLAAIPKESLPEYYGGANANFETNSNRNAARSMENDGDNNELNEITIEAGEKLDLDYQVETPNSILRWEIETIEFDIGFAIRFETEQLQIYSRLNSHLAKAEGQLLCKNPGTYTVLLDNSYSRIRSKTVRYKIYVECGI